MDILKKTIRLEIAKSAELSYDSMSVADCLVLLNLSKDELLLFCKQVGWIIVNDLVQFSKKELLVQKVPCQQIIKECLGYAMELERIV